MKKNKIALGLILVICLSIITPLMTNGSNLDESIIQQDDSIRDENKNENENAGPFFPDPPVGTITVINPNSTSLWIPGNSYEVTWEWTGNFDTVLIALTTEEGYHSMASVQTQNDGSYMWNFPMELTIGGNDFRIYISVFDTYYPNYIYDYSDYFSVGGYIPWPSDSVSITTPTSATTWTGGTTQQIKWVYTGFLFLAVTIDLYKGGSFHSQIAPYAGNAGYYPWDIPWDIPTGSDYQIRIEKTGSPSVFDYSEQFTIIKGSNPFPPIPAFLIVTTPDSSTSLESGTAQQIQWFSYLCSNTIDIQLWKGGTCLDDIVIGTGNDGNYVWDSPVDLLEADDYRIKVLDHLTPSIQSFSVYFSIVNPPGTSVISTPNGTNVNVTDADTGLEITFENVTDDGVTVIIESAEEPEPPTGFEVAGDYYDISTDATFSGTISVAIPYDESQVQGNEKHLKLYHWEPETGWTDVTTSVDTENNIIYGEITSFSIFIILEPSLSGKIEDLIEKVQNSSEDCWRHPEDNRKSTMLEKLEELNALIIAEDLEEAYDKLLHDIKPKLTGLKTDEYENPWGNGVFKNPWIICSELNQEFQVDCNDILSLIKISINAY